MSEYRHVKLFRNGHNQVVRIPREFELPDGEAVMRRDGDRLIIEPLPKQGLAEVLRGLKPVTDGLPLILDSPAEPVVLLVFAVKREP
jgi:antitoxin VapB